MRKVLFLMFLLLLMGLGAASVKAQVRIGGNGTPNAAAVLDLNATDTTNYGIKGLALPRVSLSSNTVILAGTANLAGMLVYNTGGPLANGIYFWSGTRWNTLIQSNSIGSWQTTFWGTVNAPAIPAGSYASVTANGVLHGDVCACTNTDLFLVLSDNNLVVIHNWTQSPSAAVAVGIICYGPR